MDKERYYVLKGTIIRKEKTNVNTFYEFWGSQFHKANANKHKVKVDLNIVIMSYFDSPISYRSSKQIAKTRTSVKLYHKSNRLNKYTQNIPPNGYEMYTVIYSY